MKKFTSLILFLFGPALLTSAQPGARLQPGKMYEAGDKIYSPHFGFQAMIPQRWSGVLPRESEVFLLSCNYATAEVYVLGRERGDLQTMKGEWEKGIPVNESIQLQAKGPVIQEGLLFGEVALKGKAVNKSNRGFAISRCSDFGPCVTTLAVMPAPLYDSIRRDVKAFMDASRFVQPTDASPYLEFDWKKFLSGKTLTSYAIHQQGSKETTVDLCPDGKFSASVTKKGMFKDLRPEYKGKLKGTWSATGIGETTQLTLVFEKKGLSQMEVPLRISEEGVYAAEERYFVAESQKCK